MQAISHFLTKNLAGQTLVAYVITFVVPLIGPALFIRFVGIRGLRNVLSYEAKDTPIHRMDPRLKLLYPVFIGISSVVLPWQWTYILFGLSLLPWIVLRPGHNRVRFLLVMVAIPALLSIWSQGLYATTPQDRLIFAFPRTMFWVGTVGLSRAGLIYGLHQAARVLVISSPALIMVFTTQPSDIVWATSRLLSPPRLGLAISVGVRFFPLLFERLNTVMRAAEVRGYDFSTPNRWWNLRQSFGYLKRMLRAIPLMTIPILVGSLRGCGQMALVADSRAFGVNRHRTTYRVVDWRLHDRIAVAAAVVVAAGIILLVATGHSRF